MLEELVENLLFLVPLYCFLVATASVSFRYGPHLCQLIRAGWS